MFQIAVACVFFFSPESNLNYANSNHPTQYFTIVEAQNPSIHAWNYIKFVDRQFFICQYWRMFGHADVICHNTIFGSFEVAIKKLKDLVGLMFIERSRRRRKDRSECNSCALEVEHSCLSLCYNKVGGNSNVILPTYRSSSTRTRHTHKQRSQSLCAALGRFISFLIFILFSSPSSPEHLLLGDKHKIGSSCCRHHRALLQSVPGE